MGCQIDLKFCEVSQKFFVKRWKFQLSLLTNKTGFFLKKTYQLNQEGLVSVSIQPDLFIDPILEWRFWFEDVPLALINTFCK